MSARSETLERVDSVEQHNASLQREREMELPEVQVMSNRATTDTPVAFSNISRKAIEKVNDGRDIHFFFR